MAPALMFSKVDVVKYKIIMPAKGTAKKKASM